MPNSYPIVSVEEIAASQKGAIAIGPFGSRMKRSVYVDDGVPVIRGNNLGGSKTFVGDFVHVTETKADELASSVVYPGDLVFPHRGNIGSVGLVPADRDRYILSTSLMKLSVDQEKVDPNFLFYFFLSAQGRHELLKNASQVGTPGIATPLASLRSALVPLPPLTEQRAIAHILGTLDDKIALNRRMNQTLESIARALFKSWFVDFDPVRAKAEGRARQDDARSGQQRKPLNVASDLPRLGAEAGAEAESDIRIPKHITDLFPDRFVDSELGEIPEGWDIKPISELADISGGSTPSTKIPEYWEGGVHHWLTPRYLSTLGSPALLSSDRKITDAGLATISSGLQPSGTVLLSSRAPIGYVAIAQIPVAINQGFIALRPKKGVPHVFLWQWLLASMGEIRSRANGSTFLEISKTNFRPIPVICPQLAVFDSFANLARPFYQQFVANEKEMATLQLLRDSLLPRLLLRNAEMAGTNTAVVERV